MEKLVNKGGYEVTEESNYPAAIWYSFTNHERNGLIRKSKGIKTTPFTMSSELESKSASMDHALTEWNTKIGIAKLLGVTESFVSRHIKHLLAKFPHTVSMEVDGKKLRMVSAL